ncbi:MAG TPA: alcohol dehydrogenase catalytic domain-containing protein [Solirubrobacteraceae bacterium]|jgi:alcohol dehydrogenase|nr:alcohol dehydrogenase catalytic domain-containing protein [Solirubrobacteraceae bacterium]
MSSAHGHRAAVLPAAGAELVIERRELAPPGPGQVMLAVRACGVCYAEVNLMRGAYGFARYPTVPGHEVVGEVIALGPDVEWPALGARVGVPFLHSSCGHCDRCVRGDEILCAAKTVTGISADGGYQQYMLARAAFVAPLPDAIDDLDAAPLMCAGVTVFNGLRRSGMEYGARVAVIGTGGLGHLAVRFARAMGARVCVISRTAAGEDAARAAGAERYLAAEDHPDLAGALREWDGGADVILNTAPSSAPASATLEGLAPDGALVILGYGPEPVQAAGQRMVLGRARILGSPSGSRHDLRDTLAFAAANGIVPEVTAIALEEVPGTLARMAEGRLHGRAVIDFGAA